MARKKFPDTEEGRQAREAYEWSRATRSNFKAPPKKFAPEDTMPEGQRITTRGTVAPSDQTPEEMRAAARAAFLEQLRRG